MARLVDDLRALSDDHFAGGPMRLAGWSWGAMLALAFGAAWPDRVDRIALVGCGTFDAVSRARMKELIAARLTDDQKRELERLAQTEGSVAERLRASHAIVEHVYNVNALSDEDAMEIDATAHAEVWADMLSRQASGQYPASFAAIHAPVLLSHGDFDPHPGDAIAARLAPFLPQLTCVTWRACGHSPWRERGVRHAFVEHLTRWLRGEDASHVD